MSEDVGPTRHRSDKAARPSTPTIQIDLRELIEPLLTASEDAVAVLSLDGDVRFMNPAAQRVTGIIDADGVDWAAIWPSPYQALACGALAEARSGVEARFTGAVDDSAGTSTWWDVKLTPFGEGSAKAILAVAHDVTSQRKAANELRAMSEKDRLTGLPNRSAFLATLKAAVIRAMNGETRLGLLLFDLDHFSQFNDVLGASAADQLVRNVATRLRDALAGDHFLARTSGDEFAIVIEGLADDNDLSAHSEQLLLRIRAPSCHDDRLLDIGASIGGAVYPRDAATPNELLKCAGAALRAMKSQGRGAAKMFHHHMRQQAQRKASERSLARAAILARSVVPVYQPKIDLRSGAVVGTEALLRWRHHRLGLQAPETLAEAFCDHELASGLGALVQEGVFNDIARWCTVGIRFGHVSINAAPAEFVADAFAEKLLAGLDRFAIDPARIQLEITEQALFEECAGHVSRALGMLSARGIRICLDDFGTGYSSLCRLRDLPVDVLKIDRSFVARLHNQVESAAIVDALIELAGKLGIDVVAEGIETEAQLHYLRERGCSIGQGYLISKPIESAELPAFLERRRARGLARHGSFNRRTSSN